MTTSIPIKDKKTIKQIKILYAAKKDYCGLLLFSIAINTGANLKDLLALTAGDVRNKQYLTFNNGKLVFLNEEITTLIKKVIDGKKDTFPLFVGIKGHRLDRMTVLTKFKNICHELTLNENINVASWRKTFGYHHYKKYKDLSYLQWYFNQTGVEATMKYIGLEENMNAKYPKGINI